MIENVIARRYARALAEVASEKGIIEKTDEDLIVLADILDSERGEVSVPELADYLGSPVIALAEKIKMTDVLCEKLQIGELVSEFLNVLIRKGRVPLISRIAREYIRISSSIEEIVTAEVESAYSLSSVEEDKIIKALELKEQKKVRLHSKVNEALLSGVRIKIGDVLLDGSIKGRMDRIEAKLL